MATVPGVEGMVMTDKINDIRNGPVFVLQKHHARTLHYDFRLEKDGVLKSWAVPKGLPDKKGEKRLAIETEDHELDFAVFEGTIPEGEYGAGTVEIIDKGFYEIEAWTDAKITVHLKGDTVSGRFVMIRTGKPGENNWLIIKL
jgi:bifunctional non-homologous end joining protein LigD